MSEWIDVNNRLPEPRVGVPITDEVLVWTWRRDVAHYDYRDKRFYVYERGYDNSDGDRELEDRVTHWMPLPKPPKREPAP